MSSEGDDGLGESFKAKAAVKVAVGVKKKKELTPEQALAKTADWLEKNGWAQYGWAGGSVANIGQDCGCVLMALWDVSPYGNEREGAEMLLFERTWPGVDAAKVADPTRKIAVWNDMKDRTLEEVLKVLRGQAAVDNNSEAE